VSITKNYTDGDDLGGDKWKQWWQNPENVELYQFMGKDNVPFHTVLFPGSQLGTRGKWTKVKSLSTSEYLNYEGGKFSKSRGIGVFGNTARDTGISPDVWRFYLLSRRPETSDAEFKWQELIDANNNELLNNVGNLVNRTLKFVASQMDSTVPDYTGYTNESLKNYEAEIQQHLTDYIAALEANKLRAGLSEALHISATANRLLGDNKLSTQLLTEDPARCAAAVGIALSVIQLLGGVLSPYMPGVAVSILEQLGVEPSAAVVPDVFDAAAIKPGHRIGKPAHLFGTIKADKAEEWREAFGGEEARRAKAEAASAAATKKAQKQADKLKKKLKKEGAQVASAVAGAKEGEASSATAIESVEHADKVQTADPAVEAVTEALSHTEVHTS
jgi:methionyl-tRNA synthetase